MSMSVEECPRAETVTLKIPSDVRLSISPEDFWTLCTYNKFPRLERTARGELNAMWPAGLQMGLIITKVLLNLFNQARQERKGIVLGGRGGFTLPNGAIRAASGGCWIAMERWDALTDEQRSVFAPVVPDFVIEVLSLWDNRQAIHEHMLEYIEQGTRLGWLIDARTPAYEVEIHRPGQAVEILKQPETVSGEDVLPGHVLELGKIIAGAD